MSHLRYGPRRAPNGLPVITRLTAPVLTDAKRGWNGICGTRNRLAQRIALPAGRDML